MSDPQNFIVEETKSVYVVSVGEAGPAGTSVSDPKNVVVEEIKSIHVVSVGEAGPPGTSGYSGAGVSGYSGYSGQDGAAGASGTSGYSGYSGSGVSGYSGYSGAGVSGYSGYSGQGGTAGASGTSGYSGSGVSGYSGWSGISGWSGVSGYSGWSGISGWSGVGTVSTVSFTGGLLSVATPTTTPAFTVAGTSGGIPYFSAATTWASSAALTQYGLVIGGGAGATPYTSTGLTFGGAAAGTGLYLAAGTATTDVNLLLGTMTMNAAAVNFTGAKLTFTEGASGTGATTKLLDILYGTSGAEGSKFAIYKTGTVQAANGATATPSYAGANIASGLWFSGNDVRISANGTNALIITSGVVQAGAAAIGLRMSAALGTISTYPIGWGSNTTILTAFDTAFSRISAGLIGVGTGEAGSFAGSLKLTDTQAMSGALTAGTMTVDKSAYVKKVLHKFAWTNAMVTALGAVTTGDILVGTLPAGTVVTNAYMVVGTAETALTALTGAIGRTGATYLDYIVASNLKAAANTLYGGASGERGTNLTGYDVPSYTATTGVYLHLISNVENLSAAVACTGTVYIETMILP